MTQVREDISFQSAGDEIAAWLYRPGGADGAEPVPCVVMAHGFSGTRRDRLPAYAERFADAGFAVLLFDYRGFGDSARRAAPGRRHPPPARGLRGRDRRRAGARGDRPGAHRAVRLLVQRRPRRRARRAPSRDRGGDRAGAVSRTASCSCASRRRRSRCGRPSTAIRDQIGAWRGREPVMIAPVGPPGSYAVMTAPEAEPGFLAIDGRGPALAERRRRSDHAPRRLVPPGRQGRSRALPAARPGRRLRRDDAARAGDADGPARAAAASCCATRRATSSPISASCSSASSAIRSRSCSACWRRAAVAA